MKNPKEKQEEILAQDILRKVNHKMKLMKIAKDKKLIRLIVSLFIACIAIISFSAIFPRFYVNESHLIILFVPLFFAPIAILNKRLDAAIELIEILETNDKQSHQRNSEQSGDFSKD